MSTASLAASEKGAAVRIDRLFFGLALAATAILIVMVLLDHQPASAALILGGFGLGIAFLKAEFSYTASWRRFLTRGEAGGLLGGLIVIAICALAVVPVAALSPKFGGAIAPLGPSLIIGAFVFGIGMQLANGCGSGTLYTVGGGSGRMLIALVVLRHRQRIWQPFAAGISCSRRRGSGVGVGLSRRLGRAGSDACQHCHCGCAHYCGRQAPRRQLRAVTKLRDRWSCHRPAVCCRLRRWRPSVERHLRLYGVGRQSRDCARF